MNLVLRGWCITGEPIALDEPFSIYHAQFPLHRLTQLLSGYNNPPLFEIILHYWIGVAGIEPLAVRTLPLIFAALSPVALYYLGRKHFSMTHGIVASLLLSFSSLLTFYAHDCRVYSLFVLLTILAMDAFLRYLSAPGLRAALLLAVLNTLLIYAHYFGFIVMGLQLLFLIFFYRGKPHLTLITYGLTALLYLPQFIVMYIRASQSISGGTWISPPEGLESLYNMLWSFSNAPVVTVINMVLLGTAVVFLIIRKQVARIPKGWVFIAGWFIFPFLGMYLISYKVPMYIDRYLIFILPAWCLLLSGAATSLFPKTRPRLVALTLLAALFALSKNLNPPKNQPINELMGIVQTEKNDSTLVLISPPDFMTTFAYHFDRNVFSTIDPASEYAACEKALQKQHVYFPDQENLSISRYNKILLISTDGKIRVLPPHIVTAVPVRELSTQRPKAEWAIQTFSIFSH